MTERRRRQVPHTPERRARPCPRCQAPVPPARHDQFCSTRCRVLWFCDHPLRAGVCTEGQREARLVAWVEARFSHARLQIRRESRYTVDPWAQRAGAPDPWDAEE